MAYELKEVIEQLKGNSWHSIVCITADLVKNTGGKILHFQQCRVARRKTMGQAAAESASSTEIKRPANHNENFTINLELPNGEMRKIHPVLITQFNGVPVL